MAPRSSEPLDPALRSKLLLEAKTPWRGLRRALWLALSASSAIGLATMAMRASSGAEVPGSDLLIQVAALAVFGGLLLVDRHRAGNGPGAGDRPGLDRD
ncbi:MAG: hypothetical protein CK536_01790 [Synechococcus sp. Baikal-G1]|nr:MAG: hypothetical protein CK536_01790 [Synechococcus sp. Baikal-G1]